MRELQDEVRDSTAVPPRYERVLLVTIEAPPQAGRPSTSSSVCTSCFRIRLTARFQPRHMMAPAASAANRVRPQQQRRRKIRQETLYVEQLACDSQRPRNLGRDARLCGHTRALQELD